jgi:pectate lyase
VLDACYTDIVVETKVKVDFPGSSTSYIAGPCVRVEDEDNYYIVGLMGNGNVGILMIDGGDSESIDNGSSASWDQGGWYTLRVEVEGTTLRGYLEDSLIVETTDATHSFGSVGVCVRNGDALFDDFVVTLP